MDRAIDRLRDLISVPVRVRERAEPAVVAVYRLEPPPPVAQLQLQGSPLLGSLWDLLLLISEGPAILYHAVSIPRIR